MAKRTKSQITAWFTYLHERAKIHVNVLLTIERTNPHVNALHLEQDQIIPKSMLYFSEGGQITYQSCNICFILLFVKKQEERSKIIGERF